MLSKQFAASIGSKTYYDTILDGGKYKTEYRVVATIAIPSSYGVASLQEKPFLQNDGLISVDIDWGIFGDSVAIGCVQARQIVAKLRFPKSSNYILGDYGLALDARLIDIDSRKVSDWLHTGRFFISRRKQIGEILELTCYDEVLKTQGDFFANGADLGEWPQPMKTVATSIANRIGVRISVPSALPDYPMEAPVGLTMRDVLSSIATAWGGNWIVKAPGATSTWETNWKSTLRLLPLGESLGTYTAGKRAVSAAAIGEKVSFSGVRMFWSDTDCFESGKVQFTRDYTG